MRYAIRPAVKFLARKTGLSNDVVYWICIGLNFAVIFLGIAWLMRKKLPGYLRAAHRRSRRALKRREERVKMRASG